MQRQGEPLAEGAEARDGVTPAMRDARRRLFRRPLQVSPDLVRRVEEDILTVAAVRAGPAACSLAAFLLAVCAGASFGSLLYGKRLVKLLVRHATL